jgi:5-methyltetrahydrofolate--homocysteine methyltransferase
VDRFWQLLRECVVLFDGGLGTELLKEGLPSGACPELWNVEKPEVVRRIHRSYFEAGSDVVSTNSFGGSRLKLASHGLAERCFELNLAAAGNAAEVRPAGKFIAGSLGPTGQFLKPQGKCEEKELEEAFAVQADALAKGGADFLLVETMYDLREALCAVRAARNSSPLSTFVTMTFNRTPRGFFTLMGNSVRQCFQALESAGVSVLGANCTLNIADMADLTLEMRKETSLPLLVQANAGQPSLADDGKVVYSQSPEDYVKYIPRIIANGARLVGGCCGTDPDYVRRMAAVIHSQL